MRPALLLLPLLAALAARPAAALDPTRALTQYGLEAWQTDEGLPQNTVEALAQTPDGFLWVATQEGLVRFDGMHFTVFDAQNTPALNRSMVQTLEVTRDGTLWMGTLAGGLASFRAGEFRSHLPPPTDVRDLLETRDGTLWVATSTGLLRREGERFVPIPAAQGLHPGAIITLGTDRAGTLWLALRDGRVQSYRDGHFTDFPGQLPGARVYAIAEDAQGAMWFATRGHGALRWKDGKLESFGAAQGLPHRTVYALLPSPDGTLWLGTDSGLVRRYADRFETLDESQGLSADAVYSLLADTEGDLWVGTSGGGLARLREGAFVPLGTPEGLSGNKVRAVYEARDGALWVGTDGGGLDVVRGRAVQHFGPAQGLASDQVFSLHEDAEGRLWAGSFGQGLSVLEPGASRFRVQGRKDGLPGDVVNAFAELQGQLYAGTSGGLARRVGQRFEVVPGFEDLNIVALQPARGGGLWVGTQTRGLGRLKDGRAQPFLGTKDGLGSDYVTSVLEREDGTLWLTTFGGGLVRVSGGKPHTFTRAQGMPEDALHAVVDDGHGQLWMSSNKGVYSVPLQSLEDVAAGRAPRLSVRTWGTANGMRSSECNGGEQPVAIRGRDGRLHFATIKGVATVDPGHPAPTPAPPTVYVERVVVDGQEVPAQDGLRVPPGARNVEVHYTAPVLHAPERVRFRYRLEGSDPAWSEVAGRRTAYFTGLDPGRYVFRVMAARDEGSWGEPGAALRFTLVPHFHQTPAFAALVVLALMLAVAGAYALRIRYVRRREHELVAHNAELTAALATAQEAARVKGEFVANTSHELRTPLNTLINAPQVLLRQFTSVPGAACQACSAHFELEPGEKLEPQSPCPECGAVGRLHEEPRWQLHGEPGKVVRLLEMMRSSGKHLLEVVDDVLDFSKLEAGRVVVEPRRLPVSELFESVITTVQPAARARRIRLEVKLPSQPLVLWADPLRSQQVLINLLSNAVKFSSEDSSVRLEAARDGESSALLTVRDRGVGIAPEHHRLIFESFRQVDGTHTRRVGGTGLGLSIVKRLVDLQGGAIWLESALGQGSTFYVRLPLAPAVEDEQVPPAPESSNDASNGTSSGTSVGGASGAAATELPR